MPTDKTAYLKAVDEACVSNACHSLSIDAFQSVNDSLNKVLSGDNAGDVVDDAHGDWYRQLFSPGFAAGIVDAVDLAGYRNGPVYIRRSCTCRRRATPYVTAYRRCSNC